MEDNKSLIEIFCTTEYEEYEQIVTLLEKVEKAKDKELFDQCLKLGSKLSNENKKDILTFMNNKFNKLLSKDELLYLNGLSEILKDKKQTKRLVK